MPGDLITHICSYLDYETTDNADNLELNKFFKNLLGCDTNLVYSISYGVHDDNDRMQIILDIGLEYRSCEVYRGIVSGNDDNFCDLLQAITSINQFSNKYLPILEKQSWWSHCVNKKPTLLTMANDCYCCS